MPAARPGEIILVHQLLDPQGMNPKDRPCVVASDAQGDPGRVSYLVVAISTVVPDPVPLDHILLPWQLPRHPVTGLNRRAAAICSWVDEVGEGRILRRIGVVPPAYWLRIADALERRTRD